MAANQTTLPKRPDITERLALYWRTYADLPSLALHPQTPCYTHGMLIGDTRDARLEIERLRAALEQAQSDLASKTTIPETADLRDGNWWPNVAKFLTQLDGHPDMWHSDADLKYLNVRVDTRDGAFRLSDRNGNPIHPDRVLGALKNVRS